MWPPAPPAESPSSGGTLASILEAARSVPAETAEVLETADFAESVLIGAASAVGASVALLCCSLCLFFVRSVFAIFSGKLSAPEETETEASKAEADREGGYRSSSSSDDGQTEKAAKLAQKRSKKRTPRL